jgi:sugar lactone lactonase YvrE
MPEQPQPVGTVRAQLGEGPCWDDKRKVLLWVDIYGKAVHVTDPDGATATFAMPERPTAIAPIANGQVLVALAAGLTVFDPLTGSAGTGLDLSLGAGIRLNDGASDPLGRFWVGSMAEDDRPGCGYLYRAHRGGVDAVLADVGLSNGIDWSPDGSRMYYVDSLTQRIDVFDFSDGEPTSRAPLVEIPADAGLPDGITVDTDGGIWVALFGGGAVRRYTPDGSLDLELLIPADNVTACAFGGPERDRLYITTASVQVADERRPLQPDAGALFAVSTGHQGSPTRYLDVSCLPGTLAG